MATIKYEFYGVDSKGKKTPIMGGSIAEGYTRISITGGIAEIDEADTEAIALAERRGGQPVVSRKSARSKTGGAK